MPRYYEAVKDLDEWKVDAIVEPEDGGGWETERAQAVDGEEEDDE